MKKQNQVYLGLFITIAALLALFQNCSEDSGSVSSSMSVSSSSLSSDDARLISILTEAKTYSDDLASSAEADANRIKQDLDNAIANIEILVKEERVQNDDPRLLREIDYLILALSKAGDFNLQLQINDIKADLAALRVEFETFKEGVTSRFAAAEDAIEQLRVDVDSLFEFKLEIIKDHEELKAELDTLDKSMTDRIKDLRASTQDLANALDDIKNADVKTKNLVDLLCATEGEGRQVITDPESAANMVNSTGANANSCIGVEAINCELMFNASESGPLGQCELIVATLKNHDLQLKQIKEIDQAQNEALDNIAKWADGVDSKLGTITDSLEDMNDVLGRAVSSLNDRVFILELKAAKTEIKDVLEERAALNLAWITRRKLDVRDVFCVSKVNNALKKFDYEAARMNHQFCHEKLKLLNRAEELTQLASALALGGASTNLDVQCTQSIAAAGNRPANELSSVDLQNTQIFNEVEQTCTLGGMPLALGRFVNAKRLLERVGPDFRTLAYMNTKPGVGQIVTYGKKIAELSAAERNFYGNIDPLTNLELNASLYGKVERVFKNRYVETRLRTADGRFPTEASDIPAIANSIKQTYSHAEALLIPALKEFEMDYAGFEITGRKAGAVNNPQVSSGGHYEFIGNMDNQLKDIQKYSFPKDAEELCPIQNQHVVLTHNDGHSYVYSVKYNGIYEKMSPVLSGGNHVRIKNAGAVEGQHNVCGRSRNFHISRNGLKDVKVRGRWVIKATKPYARAYGKAQCMKYTAVCEAMDSASEWTAPTGSKNWVSYLNGFAQADVQAQCNSDFNTTNMAVREVSVSGADYDRIRVFDPSSANSKNASLLSEIAAADKSVNPLGAEYWITKNASVPYGDQNLSANMPLVGSNGVSNSFIRAIQSAASAGLDLRLQECGAQ